MNVTCLWREDREDAVFRFAEYGQSWGIGFTGLSCQATAQYLNSNQDSCLAQRQIARITSR
jgi:hypothetical protein